MSLYVLDFVVYPGDPADGVQGVPITQALQDKSVQAALKFPDVYGAVVLTKNGKEQFERLPDLILPLLTNFVRSVPYLIDGEPETTLLTESAHGFLFEPSGSEILFSVFAGDAYEPDEYLLSPVNLDTEAFLEQVLSLGERLDSLAKSCDPGLYERDDYSKSLLEFLEIGRNAFKTYVLEKQRGLRPV